MKSDFKVIVLISGRGSNLKALLAEAKNYKITNVISNKAKAPGLNYARNEEVPTEVFPVADYPSVREQKRAIYQKIEELNPDLIALAGYMQILETEFVDQFYGRIVNIHPSLLPELAGLDTHKRALEQNLKRHGCSVHFVDKGVDTGPLIAQATCPVLPEDGEESLAARVLTHEHMLYPWVINNLATKDIVFNSRKINFSDKALGEAQSKKFILPEQ